MTSKMEKMIINATGKSSLLEEILALKISINHSCGGNGTCGTCQVKICSGAENISNRNELESEMAKERGFLANERLSCQTKIKNEVEIEIPI